MTSPLYGDREAVSFQGSGVAELDKAGQVQHLNSKLSCKCKTSKTVTGYEIFTE